MSCSRKCCAATLKVTLVWLFTGMRAHVILKMSWLIERCTATLKITLVWLFTGVNSPMRFNRILSCTKQLPAHALVLASTCVAFGDDLSASLAVRPRLSGTGSPFAGEGFHQTPPPIPKNTQRPTSGNRMPKTTKSWNRRSAFLKKPSLKNSGVVR